MEHDTAITLVKVISVLHFISAGGCVLLGLLFMVAGPLVATEPTLAGIATEVVLVVLAFIGILFILSGIVDLFIGIGLWGRKSWGRILTIVIYWILAILGLIGAIASLAQGDWIGGLTTLVIWTGISIVMIWLFQFQKDVVAVFGPQPTQAAQPVPAAPAQPVAASPVVAKKKPVRAKK